MEFIKRLFRKESVVEKKEESDFYRCSSCCLDKGFRNNRAYVQYEGNSYCLGHYIQRVEPNSKENRTLIQDLLARRVMGVI